MSVIVTEGLSKHYGSRVGVEHIDLSIDAGSVCAFLGPNGVGKTTTIRLLLGFLRPTRGAARILGLDCWRDGRKIREDVGYVPGDLRLHSWLTARRALRLFSRIRRRSVEKRGLELAGTFGLELDLRVRDMSRGMRQKLGLILALAPDPKLLILDEPTSSLDPVIQDVFKNELQALADRGHTIFFSSHTLSEVDRLCERAIILKNGRVVEDSSVQGLRERARREVIIRWRSDPGPPAQVPAGLDLREQVGLVWRGSLDGPVDDLVRWLAAQQIEDVVVRPPDLEAVFSRYYEE